MPHPANRLNTIRVVKGQTKVLTVTVKTQNGAPSSVIGSTIYFTARDSAGVTAITKISPDGIEVTDGKNGTFVVTLSSSDTNLTPGKYRYDVWVEFTHTPPVRHPVVKAADMVVEDSITQFA